MSDIIANLRDEIKRINDKPCECIACPDCRGLGNIRVDFRTGLPSHGHDDLDELEPCESCHGGIVEACGRCTEIEELYEQIEEEECQNQRRRELSI